MRGFYKERVFDGAIVAAELAAFNASDLNAAEVDG